MNNWSWDNVGGTFWSFGDRRRWVAPFGRPHRLAIGVHMDSGCASLAGRLLAAGEEIQIALLESLEMKVFLFGAVPNFLSG